MTKKVYRAKSTLDSVSKAWGLVWREGKRKTAPCCTWHYKTNHTTRHALHQWKHEGLVPDAVITPRIFKTFHRCRNSSSWWVRDSRCFAQSQEHSMWRCRGTAFHFSNKQTTGQGMSRILDVLCLPCHQAQSWCLPLSLMYMGSHSMSILQQKHQQQCVTRFTPHRETLNYGIHIFPVIPLNQG